MVAKTPQQQAAVDRLKRWSASPEGGGKVMLWGTPGAFARCRAFYKGKIPGHMIDGFCAEVYHLATGAWPGHDDHDDHDGNGKGKG